jgi:hypothetical protein
MHDGFADDLATTGFLGDTFRGLASIFGVSSKAFDKVDPKGRLRFLVGLVVSFTSGISSSSLLLSSEESLLLFEGLIRACLL